jgi:hypothetical protein
LDTIPERAIETPGGRSGADLVRLLDHWGIPPASQANALRAMTGLANGGITRPYGLAGALGYDPTDARNGAIPTSAFHAAQDYVEQRGFPAQVHFSILLRHTRATQSP